MYSQDLALIGRGADVYDRNGDWLGSVGKVCLATLSEMPTSVATTVQVTSEPRCWLEVGTGLQRLGKALYVPDNAVAHICDDWVILDVAGADLDSLGWDAQPAALRS
jgi:hypothetical protein